MRYNSWDINAYITNIFNFFLVLLMVLLSKTVYFGIIFQNTTFYIFVIFATILFFLKGISKNNLLIFFIFILLLGINIITYFSSIDSFVALGLRRMILSLLPIAIITSYMTRKEFAKQYVNIICVFALISLACIFIANFLPDYVGFLSKNVLIGKTYYKISPLYTWGWNTIFIRNSGPFWEPGGFQGFINVALLLLLFYKENINKSNIKILILSIALLTTQSTTGYIIFLIIIVIFGFEIITKFHINIIFKGVILGLIIFCGIYIISTNNINNKLDPSNQSTIIRGNDFTNSIKMITEKPMFGYGEGSARFERELELNIINNSNGLLNMVYIFGLVFSVYYIYRLIKGINIMFYTNNNMKKIGIISVFIILHFTEGLIWLPVYLTLLFHWNETFSDSSAIQQ